MEAIEGISVVRKKIIITGEHEGTNPQWMLAV
jgi:hypothetical protein